MCKNEPDGKRLQMIDKEGNELPIIDKNCDLNFNAVPWISKMFNGSCKFKQKYEKTFQAPLKIAQQKSPWLMKFKNKF